MSALRAIAVPRFLIPAALSSASGFPLYLLIIYASSLGGNDVDSFPAKMVCSSPGGGDGKEAQRNPSPDLNGGTCHSGLGIVRSCHACEHVCVEQDHSPSMGV